MVSLCFPECVIQWTDDCRWYVPRPSLLSCPRQERREACSTIRIGVVCPAELGTTPHGTPSQPLGAAGWETVWHGMACLIPGIRILMNIDLHRCIYLLVPVLICANTMEVMFFSHCRAFLDQWAVMSQPYYCSHHVRDPKKYVWPASTLFCGWMDPMFKGGCYYDVNIMLVGSGQFPCVVSCCLMQYHTEFQPRLGYKYWLNAGLGAGVITRMRSF